MVNYPLTHIQRNQEIFNGKPIIKKVISMTMVK